MEYHINVQHMHEELLCLLGEDPVPRTPFSTTQELRLSFIFTSIGGLQQCTDDDVF